jgi:hypothetical protein
MRRNQLDSVLLDSVRKANVQYEKMTDGYWLWHAPESFVQMAIAAEIHKKLDVCVYPECTPLGIARDATKATQLGRPPHTNEQQRFDLVVWWKNQTRPRAIVEIKLTYASMKGVLSDADKLVSFRKAAVRRGRPRHGYLVVFNSAYRNPELDKSRQGAETIRSRFKRVSDQITGDFTLVGEYISRESTFGDKLHSFGVAVWRMDFNN